MAGSLLAALAGCGGDDAETPPVLTLADDFAGDVFDAACALLEQSPLDDPQETVEAVLDSLAATGGVDAAIKTLQLAVPDRCPDWQADLDAVLATRA